jgi:hypothetical protein
MNWTQQEIPVKTTRTGIRTPRRAYVSEDGLFAINLTWPAVPDFGWSITHVPTGHSLSSGHSNRRNAELFAAIWRALPLPWQRRTAAPIIAAYKKMPPQLQSWVKAVKPAPEPKKG